MSNKGNAVKHAAAPAASVAPADKKADKKTPRERFVTVGAARVTKALVAIHNLKNISSRKSYEYSESDVRAMFEAIDAEYSTIKKCFETALAGGKPVSEKKVFKF